MRLNMADEWQNGAYDEDGNQVYCSWCDGEMKWNPEAQNWYCTECGTEMNREDYFNYIGAMSESCCLSCSENYPFCRSTCEKHP